MNDLCLSEDWEHCKRPRVHLDTHRPDDTISAAPSPNIKNGAHGGVCAPQPSPAGDIHRPHGAGGQLPVRQPDSSASSTI